MTTFTKNLSPSDRGKELHTAILGWLNRQQEGLPDLKKLDKLLQRTQEAALPPAVLHNPLELLFSCLNRHLPEFIGQLVGVRIPLSRHHREQVDILQIVLDNFALTYAWQLENNEAESTPEERAIFAERVAFCLSQYIYICYLVAAPVDHGIWLRLHRVVGAGLWRTSGRELPFSYREAILLAAAQPGSFTSRELTQIAGCLVRHAEKIKFYPFPPTQTRERESTFWIDPARDFPLFALNRREPMPGERVFYFVGAEIAARLRAEYENQNTSPKAEPRLKKNLLLRLLGALENPGKRRFARRRKQSDLRRVQANVGFEACCRLLRQEKTEGEYESKWMVVNESLDGYALMLLNGKVGSVRVGDPIVLCLGEAIGRLVCLIRWVQSENPEHLEIGVQVIALDAIPVSSADTKAEFLLLPEHLPARESQALLAPGGMIGGEKCRLILGSGEERDVRLTGIHEQNSRVDIFNIAEATS
ncbi:MAG: hypothetical protein LBB55_01645 [Zoogloeaceae bacterium]|jgi:hypothetical protein|nr:hypothetical protein [Zoogloeaceae bacterium]